MKYSKLQTTLQNLTNENISISKMYLKRLRYNAYKKGISTFTITPDKIHNLYIKEVTAE